MKDVESLESLKEENERLKTDNDRLLDIVVQMRVTLNRLIDRYVADRRGE